MEKEIIFNYKDIGGNVFTREGVTLQEQIFELLNTYYGITRKEFNPKEIEVKQNENNWFNKATPRDRRFKQAYQNVFNR